MQKISKNLQKIAKKSTNLSVNLYFSINVFLFRVKKELGRLMKGLP